ncbi:MAG: hypothetical protein WC375_03280, partial [Methanomassiliicoccales archaeon]
MTPQELADVVSFYNYSPESSSQIMGALQQAYKLKFGGIMDIAVRNPVIIANRTLANYVILTIHDGLNNDNPHNGKTWAYDLLSHLLDHPKEVVSQVYQNHPSLFEICSFNPQTVAISLLKGGTPYKITEKIMQQIPLNMPKTKNGLYQSSELDDPNSQSQNSPYLNAIMRRLPSTP